jgi:hypothetical protein
LGERIIASVTGTKFVTGFTVNVFDAAGAGACAACPDEPSATARTVHSNAALIGYFIALSLGSEMMRAGNERVSSRTASRSAAGNVHATAYSPPRSGFALLRRSGSALLERRVRLQ